MPDGWVYQGERAQQLAETGLDAAGIAAAARKAALGAAQRTARATLGVS
jgi:hypothetical protein